MRTQSIALELLGAGLIVVGGKGLWARGNAAARRLLGLPEEAGRARLLDALRRSPELRALLEAGSGRKELKLDAGPFHCKLDARAFALGPRGWRTVLLLVDVTENAALLEKLSNLASKDALTGICNRRRFDELGARDIDLSRRTGTVVGVLMMDIDFFKRVNDDHGHEAGDRVLKAICSACEEALRSTDVLGRYGGEEFAVFLPGSGPEESLAVAERLRAQVAALVIPCDEGKVSVTVSIGVYSSAPGPGDELALYMRRADEALYKSKAMGRNRVSYWEPLI